MSQTRAKNNWALDALEDLRRLEKNPGTDAIREVGRHYAALLRRQPPNRVIRFAQALLKSRNWPARVIAFETVRDHRAAFESLTDRLIHTWSKGLSDWGSTDLFGVTIAGPAWREGLISDDTVLKWAKSKDRWYRRLALVATVPLNSKARGGTGDAIRTLTICRILLSDGDKMVVKAMSWALRELAKRDVKTVRSFLRQERLRIPALVRREVTNKLNTGKKAGR
jgi:3-methyladenine DNA glycosylase AlkD